MRDHTLLPATEAHQQRWPSCPYPSQWLDLPTPGDARLSWPKLLCTYLVLLLYNRIILLALCIVFGSCWWNSCIPLRTSSVMMMDELCIFVVSDIGLQLRVKCFLWYPWLLICLYINYYQLRHGCSQDFQGGGAPHYLWYTTVARLLLRLTKNDIDVGVEYLTVVCGGGLSCLDSKLHDK